MPEIEPLLDGAKNIQDDSVLQQYPSPIAEVQDGTSFYTDDHANHEHQHLEQSTDPHETGSPSPRQQAAHPGITSAEELQLAAQLSQDLSQGIPSMLESTDNRNDDPNLRNGIPHHEPHDPQLHHDDQLASDLDRQDDQHMLHVDQSMPPHEHPVEHHEEPLQHSHEQASQSPYLPDEQQPLDQQPQYIPNQQQHNDQQMQQHYVLDQQQQQPLSSQPRQTLQQPHPPLQPHGALDQLAQQYAAHAHQTVQDNIPPRKRSKVSRACDECRRKKVKCDAASETGEEPCSNCRRSSIRCLFSRIPQKRGPSKGYIKELADRIHHIEGKLASEGNIDALTELLGGGRRESSDIFAPSGHTDENSRKRPYSSISGADFGTPNSSRQGTWNSEPRPIQPYQTPSNGPRGTPYSANGLAPHPLSKPEADTPPRRAASIDAIPIDLDDSSPLKEVNGDAFDVYLNVVHQCFPVLARNKERIEAQLSQCPPLLRDAFTEAFYSTMQSFVSAPGLYTNGDIGSATRLIAEWESDPSPRNSLRNLVHLQALILTAIGTDNYGPSSLKGEHGGPSKASVLGRAVGLAYSMRLHLASLDTSTDVEPDDDSDESIAIRAWWTLVMLDRWNAISTASPLFIPNDSVVILPGLIPLLGENGYHVIRLSNILGHFAPVSLTPPRALSPDATAVPILNSFFNLAIELFREVLPANIAPSTHPILNLVYWHSRLLSYLFQTNARSKDVFWACKESVGLLLANAQLLSPLNHHFFCLTTLSLLELSKVDKTQEEATSLLKDLLDFNLAPSTWDGVIRDRIAEYIRPSTAQAATNRSLKHLADLATASEADATKLENGTGPTTLRISTTYADLGFDPRAILHGGYLNVLAGDHATATR
ncbi:hypothetical protein F5Y19DRAFT_138750 [Xylariaceae sp. FL1651]|nr:hypothetical protein F5Y19DRAFT_138750 [Xylariaceae sp. FL1651]